MQHYGTIIIMIHTFYVLDMRVYVQREGVGDDGGKKMGIICGELLSTLLFIFL